MRVTRNATRRNALDKLAALSAQTQDNGHDIAQLCDLGRPKATHQVNDFNNTPSKGLQTAAIPMGVRELEILLALSKAAPLVQATEDAERLLAQLAPYVPEAHRQSFSPSAFTLQLPPWQTLAQDLTSAVLALGLNHPSLGPLVLDTIDQTIHALTDSAESAAWLKPQTNGADNQGTSEQPLQAIQLTVCLLGFLEAIAESVRVWTVAQRLSVIQRLRDLLSEKFMVSLEGALSAVRNARSYSRQVKEWKRWAQHYAAQGRPLGAMLLQQAFMKVVEASMTLLISPTEPSPSTNPLDTLMWRSPLVDPTSTHVGDAILENLTDVIADEMNLLEADADYLQVSSAWQQQIALDVKARSLRSFLCCNLLNEDIADDELLMSWLEAITANPLQMADEGLGQTVLKSMAILARTSLTMASSLSRSLPRLIVQGRMTPQTAAVAGICLASVLKSLSQDIVISTLYSLGNVLSASTADKPRGTSPFFYSNGNHNQATGPYAGQQSVGSSISLIASDDEETAIVYGSVVQAIISIATACDDGQITALVLSMLVQKVGRISLAVDARIITETAALGLSGGPNELKTLLRMYARVSGEATLQHNSLMLHAVTDARVKLASAIRKDTPLYEACLMHMLALIVSCGDTAGDRIMDTATASQQIAQLLRPLAVLVSSDTEHEPTYEAEEDVRSMSRDAWFNVVVHGFTLTSDAGKEHAEDLQILAQHSLPLVDEARVDMPESGIDLNTVLRRGSSAPNMVEQKSALIAAIPSLESDIKGLSYQDCVYLNAALLVSTLRAQAGDCTSVLLYFMENKIKSTDMGKCMLVISTHAVDLYLQQALSGAQQSFGAPQLALQLAKLFEGCCHRISKVQHAAVCAADRIVNKMPSVLCQKASLFALLELLTLMWRSCLDAETDEYDLKSTYSSTRVNVSIQLSDDVNFRQTTLTNFHKRCRLWVSRAIDVAPLDTKGLLQAYLEDYYDDGAYGHLGLGSSFAVEMGSMIPSSDHRLTSIEYRQSVGINTASEFIAQYTTRQEYRDKDDQLDGDEAWALVDYGGSSQALVRADTVNSGGVAALHRLARRLRNHESVPFAEVRETLRNAAGSLSQGTADRPSVIHHLVGIPFAMFTKQSIKLGVSLWLGVVKEYPSLESRVLVEVAAGWEASLRLGRGFFTTAVQHLDPFYTKEEFAPSNWEMLAKRRELTHNLIAPHLRLAHFLSSHLSASRLTAPSVEWVYFRLMRITMLQMKQSVNQPLAREVHFHVVLLALRVLRYSTRLDAAAQWRLKDAILSAALAWFAQPPRWSYGSNRLQVRAEVKLLVDVSKTLQDSTSVGYRPTNSLTSLQLKQELLLQLIADEYGRLEVWLTPLGSDSRSSFPFSHSSTAAKDSISASHLKTAWIESPRIAVQLATRVHSQKLRSDVRSLLLAEPEKAIGEPDALYLLFGSSLPDDVKYQLKYLLYWAPLNPMAAVTYFLPAYGNHPFILQYAVRALESHSVDVTFFYVPQIVQTLRYDALGYVKRYIIETAKFSQLFAHQIIWNMKANAFKDEDSQVPDPVKPMLDKVMGAMISSFSKEDKGFYEREFDFFGKVTGISGTLKPLIKRPKPEKKQKIEEELRKIELSVGVYLPSNPDGVVIGIDRKSGKPLQSHAKAPFMATFRIRKEAELEPDEDAVPQNGDMQKRRTFEVWQSAIFKVGDDCRQDVLALQMIAAFRGIFNSCGLDVYVFPYRVTATAPGCGVIDVLPNSTSRDMLGREAVNGLYEYFVSKYGYEDSVRFQEARSNFVKSMAAYSIISYLLQFKDRHNGNIMVDDAGHILHIDFGFCFDIAPGGVKFERAPFKLTQEMVAIMGGSTNSQPFRAFEQLCVKVFLASRQYVDQLSHIVLAMLDSGLPCFKPQTIQHFRERFVLEKSDREAAEFARKLVHWSERSYSTGVYDYFQLLTNGIPY